MSSRFSLYLIDYIWYLMRLWFSFYLVDYIWEFDEIRF